ncbi:hypothetical protein PQO03_18295 [Lentisphaera profundi]|uniref:Lipoprotein n=1 Tax=Lentisphaera profundi TaxID=1658616 RepID=A0ABY7VX58_9BACT|nr:hypothetical protein [Lentisphaera profundi]WDE97780.1 hypothetical protein PQO03_18295 [Lentisphaera profundi]
MFLRIINLFACVLFLSSCSEEYISESPKVKGMQVSSNDAQWENIIKEATAKSLWHDIIKSLRTNEDVFRIKCTIEKPSKKDKSEKKVFIGEGHIKLNLTIEDLASKKTVSIVKYSQRFKQLSETRAVENAREAFLKKSNEEAATRLMHNLDAAALRYIVNQKPSQQVRNVLIKKIAAGELRKEQIRIIASCGSNAVVFSRELLKYPETCSAILYRIKAEYKDLELLTKLALNQDKSISAAASICLTKLYISEFNARYDRKCRLQFTDFIELLVNDKFKSRDAFLRYTYVIEGYQTEQEKLEQYGLLDLQEEGLLSAERLEQLKFNENSEFEFTTEDFDMMVKSYDRRLILVAFNCYQDDAKMMTALLDLYQKSSQAPIKNNKNSSMFFPTKEFLMSLLPNISANMLITRGTNEMIQTLEHRKISHNYQDLRVLLNSKVDTERLAVFRFLHENCRLRSASVLRTCLQDEKDSVLKEKFLNVVKNDSYFTR